MVMGAGLIDCSGAWDQEFQFMNFACFLLSCSENMTDREQVVATRSRTVREMKSLIAALTALGADPPSLQECLRAGAGPTTEGEDGSRLPSTLPGLRARALVEWNRVCRAVEECVLLGRELASAVAWCGDGVAHLTEVAAGVFNSDYAVWLLFCKCGC